ncbi:integrase, partial [Shigella flexneri]
MRQRELAATAKAFLLDNPEVTLQELTAHIRSMAEQFLTDASDDYWNGVEVATLVDEKSNLRELAATRALSVDQQRGIKLALEVLTAAQQRVDTGDTSGLIKLIDGGVSQLTDDNNHTDYSTIGDSTSILKNEQGDRPAVFTQERQLLTPESRESSVLFQELVTSLLAEKVQTLKQSSFKD